MAILLLLIPVSVILLGLAIWAFVWAVRGGQFDDLDTAPLDILHDQHDAASDPAEGRLRDGDRASAHRSGDSDASGQRAD